MSNQRPRRGLGKAVALAAAALALCALPSDGSAQGFGYQGRLVDNGEPFDGTVDIQAAVFPGAMAPDPLADPLRFQSVPVSNGLFSLELDFGNLVVDGQEMWLEIAVDGIPQEPRTRILPVPLALFALDGNPGPQGPAGPAGPAGPEGPQGEPGESVFTLVDGNAVHTGGDVLTDGAFGVAEDGTLVLSIGGVPVARILPAAVGGTPRPNVLLGAPTNTATAGINAAPILGGAENEARSNRVVVGGGFRNRAEGPEAVVVGGNTNIAEGPRSAIGGGLFNEAVGDGSAIPGGISNRAEGSTSFAAGLSARALHNGSFVWSDSSGPVFSSTGADQFLVRAAGGVGINTNNPGSFALAVGGNAAKPGGGSWSTLSDKRMKQDIERAAGGSLDRLLSLRAYSFRYTDEARATGLADDAEHIGFLAQEVAEVFPDWVAEGDGGTLFVTERGATAHLVEAMRELREAKQSRIDSLEERLAALERLLAE